MKKYIRTKDGKIYKALKDYMQSDLPPTKIRLENVAKDWHIIISKSQIIKQADTIEELCDEFVRVSKSVHDFLVSDDIPTKKFNDTEIYGAIWTEWGLKYVAKMNEKGELKLL